MYVNETITCSWVITAIDENGRDNLHAKVALVHQAVMVGAELHEVMQRGRSAIGPVLDVMAVQTAG